MKIFISRYIKFNGVINRLVVLLFLSKMSYVFLFAIFQLIFWCNFVIADGDCDPSYDLGFADKVGSCSSFENKIFQCDKLGLIQMDGENDDAGCMYLSGPLVFNKDLTHGSTIKLEVMKETDVASEIMWSSAVDLCKSIDNEDTPWKPVLDAMHVSECPILAGEYPIEKLKLSLDFAKDVVSHEYVGEYKVLLSIIYNTEELSCHEFAVVVFEKNNQC